MGWGYSVYDTIWNRICKKEDRVSNWPDKVVMLSHSPSQLALGSVVCSHMIVVHVMRGKVGNT